MKKCLILILLFVGSTLILVSKEKCARVVYCYDINIEVPNTQKQLYYASKGYIDQLLLNSSGENEFFTLQFQPVRILAEPWEKPAYIGPSLVNDYSIWGRLYPLDGGRYKIELNLVTAKTRELVATGSTIISDPSEAQFGGSVAALSLGASASESRPLIEVITEFEKRKRTNDPQKYKPICPEIKILDDGEKVRLKPKEVKKFKFEIKDADGEPVRGFKFIVKGYKGEVVSNEAETDYKGIGYIIHTAPEEECEYCIESVSTYYTPGEKMQQLILYQPPLIKVKKSVTELQGHLTITQRSVEISGTREDVGQKIDSKSTSSANIFLKIYPERIEYLKEKIENFNRINDESGSFAVASGKNFRKTGEETLGEPLGDPLPIQFQSEYSLYNKREGKLELDEKGTISARSKGCDIIAEIVPMGRPGTDGSPLPALVRTYCLIIKCGSNARAIFQKGEFATKGNFVLQRRNEYGEMETVTEEVSPHMHTGVCFPYYKNISSGIELIIPLQIQNSEQLENYLLNPSGSLSLSVNGSYYNTEGSPLKDIKVKAILTLTE